MMRRSTSKKVTFSPDFDTSSSYSSSKMRAVSSLGNMTSSSSSSGSEFSAVSALRFLKRVGAKVAKALRLVGSGNKKKKKKWSRKVSASSSSFTSAGLARSWSYAESSTLDSQRAEAIEDCIEFLNSSSSSSLQRSFSAASCSSLAS